METQNQIKRTIAKLEAIEHISNMLGTHNNKNRSELADQICEHFGFFDPLGRRQRSGCLKALRELEQDGHFVLPLPSRPPVSISPRRLAVQVPEPQTVPDEVGKIKELQLILVKIEEHMRIWNELMFQDHPRGAGPLVGRQLRYLVRSEHGWLGGVGFSAAALNLEDRDRWIGWDLDTRRSNLHHVVNMSRFLIRSSVSCKNLASRLLSMCIKSLPQDFKDRYGYRPLLLESFVDTSHFVGTCYRAANWLWVGRSKGRGRQDRRKVWPETIKDIYVYPLEKDFRPKMGLPANSGQDALDLASGIDGGNWSENEFGGAPLGDKRLSCRLVEAAADMAEQPGCAYSGVAGGDWARVKGYYRLIDKPDDDLSVTMSNILLPHRERTIRRMKAQQTVLCIQDGSDLNYANLDKCEGLGSIGKNQTGVQSRGLHLHSMLAVSTHGLPLGVLRAECTALEPKAEGNNRPTSTIPIEEKKTFCWIKGVRDCMQLKARMPHTSLINVMDREADFFELFDEHRGNFSSIDLLVRAKYDRRTTGEHKLFDTARQSSVQTRLKIRVQRQSARTKKSKQKARAKRLARIAEVSVRYVQVELNPPPYYKDKAPISVWVVHVSEDTPPANTQTLEWFLLTTIDIRSIDDAVNCIEWYCLRWRIEDWHRVLKSGCGIEKMAHKTAERLKRAIAINLVIAWRIMLMTLLGREAPELPAEVVFSDLELKVLRAYAKKNLSVLQTV